VRAILKVRNVPSNLLIALVLVYRTHHRDVLLVEVASFPIPMTLMEILASRLHIFATLDLNSYSSFQTQYSFIGGYYNVEISSLSGIRDIVCSKLGSESIYLTVFGLLCSRILSLHTITVIFMCEI
jgi:hypothetical protein